MNRTQTKQTGFTLIELLVVVTILVMLLAVSVPMFKPMLESRRTQNAARVLATTLEKARAQAMFEGRAVGVKLIPFETAPAAALQLRIYRENNAAVNQSSEHRIKVNNGTLEAFHYNASTEKYDTPDTLPAVFSTGVMVQFNRIGRFYELETSSTLKAPYDHLTLPNEDAADGAAMEYAVLRLPSPALTPQVIMPKGTIVDLAFSGGRGTAAKDVDERQQGQFPLKFVIPPGERQGVTIMFSPAGYIKDVFFNDTVNGLRILPNEMLYFCVGEWDRQSADGQLSLADDRKTNLQVSTTYWVTIHPKTGAVHVTENKPVSTTTDNDIIKARTFATEHYAGIDN
ncbi:MAG: prepilin-type N-terminal cleavage/methylation domain-containing protein [Planctomycetaceae bacterium]|jgi:prepilin-type N-terminal cleavage/methylation domain-containing protein|nr:prepilin-type N-terminal cleavage/methylation domain-containing protein [Planctomycetaceae bacterium]